MSSHLVYALSLSRYFTANLINKSDLCIQKPHENVKIIKCVHDDGSVISGTSAPNLFIYSFF